MVIKVNDKVFEILSLFTEGFDKALYVREVAVKAKVSSRTAHLVLKDLEEIGVLSSKVRGKIKLYSLTETRVATEYLLLAERYKKIQILQKKIVLAEILEKVIKISDGPLILFGSYAKGLEKKESDIDLLVLGSYDREKLRSVESLFNIEINIKKYTLGIFASKFKIDHLLIEVMKAHIFISGAEEILEALRHGQA